MIFICRQFWISSGICCWLFLLPSVLRRVSATEGHLLRSFWPRISRGDKIIFLKKQISTPCKIFCIGCFPSLFGSSGRCLSLSLSRANSQSVPFGRTFGVVVVVVGTSLQLTYLLPMRECEYSAAEFPITVSVLVLTSWTNRLNVQ